MDLALHGGVLGRHAEGVPAHRMQHVEARGALVARDHVAHGVVAHMAHVDAPRRIGEHLQHVVFRARVVVAGREDAALVPDLLPAGLGLAGVVAFGGHRPLCRNFPLPESPGQERKNYRLRRLINGASRPCCAALGHESADGVNGPRGRPAHRRAPPLMRGGRRRGTARSAGWLVRAANCAWRRYLRFDSKERSACAAAIPNLSGRRRNPTFRANLMERRNVVPDHGNPPSIAATGTTVERRRALARGRAARARGRRHVLLFGANDRRVLPAVLRRAPAAPRECRVSTRPARTPSAPGFRPCKRCRPNEAALADRQAAAVAKACRLIETAEEMPSLDALGAAAGLSRFHFHRVFKAVTGVTPKAYADAHRGKRVRAELACSRHRDRGDLRRGLQLQRPLLRRRARPAGHDADRISRRRQRQRRSASRSAQCSLGAILVAATDKGVCAIELGDDPDALVRDLQDRLPARG